MDLKEIMWLDAPEPEPGEKHLNCCQQTLIACCDLLGVSPEQAERMGTYFGGGMRCGGTCGPVNAALLLLGQMFGDDPACADYGKEFLTAFAEANGSWLCSDIRDEEHIRCDKAIRFANDYIKKLALNQSERQDET